MSNASGLPPIRLRHCEPTAREPGVMLFNVRRGGTPGHGGGGFAGWFMALSQDGRLACIHQTDQALQCIRRLPSGNLIFSIMDGLLVEITLAGEVVRRWYSTGRYRDQRPPTGAIPIECETLHHGLQLTADGNLLLLSMEVRAFDDWWGSTTDPRAPRERARLVGDIVMEVRLDGTKVREHRLLDILDPERITYGSRSHYWDRKGFPGTFDWCHANGMFHDARDDTILISLRTQDCVVKIDRRTGALKWILGPHERWRKPWSDKLLRPEGELMWNYHQHDPSVTPSGTIMCFDNGNHRALPFDPPTPHETNYSRAVEFAVDEARGTVRQAWSWGDGPGERLFAGFQGGALRCPVTGNTFITYGGICSIGGKPVDEPDGADTRGRMVEVTPDRRVVLELEIGGGSGDSRVLSSFRATHVAEDLALDWR